jgi:predicted phosphodiesterase
MKIQIVSDLHIDKNYNLMDTMITSLPDVHVLVLAGDICSCASSEGLELFKTFIKTYCSRYKYILHVPGNHEFHNSKTRILTPAFNPVSMFAIQARLEELQDEIPNYHYLNNKDIVIDNVHFIGTTLWHYIPSHLRPYYQNRISDYKCIYTYDSQCKLNTITPDEICMLHQTSTRYIKNKLSSTRHKVVLITHHPLIWNPIGLDFSYAYNNHLDHMLQPPIHLAIHGHTHVPVDIWKGNVHVVSNPYGYGDECASSYRSDYVVDV